MRISLDITDGWVRQITVLQINKEKSVNYEPTTIFGTRAF